jgi:hypothetical protein
VKGISRYERTRQYRLGWLFERTGWVVMAAVVAAAAIGAFGKGWLSAAEVVSADGGMSARYQRYWRAHSPTELELRWQAESGNSTIWIDAAYLDHFEVAAVTPAPATVALGGARSYYTFRVLETPALARATFRLIAKEGGSFGGALGRMDGAPIRVDQIMLP